MRLKQAILKDSYFQWKYNFYFIYGVVCLVYVVILNELADAIQAQATTILIFSDPAAIGLFVMGAIILLEKSQRVLNSLAVSPLKPQEYILSKVGSLLILSVLFAVILYLPTEKKSVAHMLLGTCFASIQFSLLGLIAGSPIRSLNQFVLASVGIELVCFIPPILSILREDYGFLKFHPFSATIRLIHGSSGSLIVDGGVNIALMILLYQICLVQVRKMFRQLGGAKL
ncbi:ABC transporter permease [Enterococcus florum]|uniref:ABC transporter permease n=1 Tax=Enterococcus florum TaxID=2480627 RepID=A0A4P5PFA5_9ENTE|nr:ABC transporter permease [Enterococcus florum]GCF92123.1 ABC transporter permease [Enterococcus florum]